MKQILQITEQLPFLEAICWQIENVYQLSPEEMLSRYERGWRYRNLFTPIDEDEKQFLKKLATEYHSWLLTEL